MKLFLATYLGATQCYSIVYFRSDLKNIGTTIINRKLYLTQNYHWFYDKLFIVCQASTTYQNFKETQSLRNIKAIVIWFYCTTFSRHKRVELTWKLPIAGDSTEHYVSKCLSTINLNSPGKNKFHQQSHIVK